MAQMNINQTKIAEKLILLNDRAVGMITRVYNIKKACSDPKSKPQLLYDKSLESAIKQIVRKFPVVDTKSNKSTFEYAASIKDEIIKNLSLYYYTFADLLELKEHMMQLLTLMDALQCQLDICVNYELTVGYLNLVVTLTSLMWLLSKVEDRRAVLGLFNTAYELSHGQSEPSFPRLGQMIIDYENPFKKLQEEFVPLNRLILASLTSLAPVYLRRNVTAETWRSYQILSFTSAPQQIVYAAQTETIACEYLSLDVMDRWIILSVLVCPTHLLNDPTVSRLWSQAAQMGLALRIFRDEVLLIHPTAHAIFSDMKGFHKRVHELKEFHANATQESLVIHMERRRFLRLAVKELCLMIKDQPGLLGPKILFVWMALSFSRDEVFWLLRHVDVWPTSKKNTVRGEELVDRQLGELLFYMLELADLVQKYSRCIHNYYTQYVVGYDVHVLSELMASLSGTLSEEDSLILSHFVRDVGCVEEADLRALRLDWFRFQARVSTSQSNFSLQSNKRLAVVMNTTVFHLKMIDSIGDLLPETCDLSIYCFYTRHLEAQWKMCIELPVQCRFAAAFARLCAHFPFCIHDMCPEETQHVKEKAHALCNTVLDDLAKAATAVIRKVCEYELRLAEQTTPSQVAAIIVDQMNRQKGAKDPPMETMTAGQESVRMDRLTLTLPDKLTTHLVEISTGIASTPEIVIANHAFHPKEYFAQQLENKLTELILEGIGVTGKEDPPICPRRPSQLLLIVQSYMAVLQNMDTMVSLDVSRMLHQALLQQSQPMDCRARDTITRIYTNWYLELLRRASTGQVLFSEHMRQMVSSGETAFSPEQFTDQHELRCLALLIGPYGVKSLCERLVWHAASQIAEMNKIVTTNKDLLLMARSRFDNGEEMAQAYNALCHLPKDQKSGTSAADAFVQRTTIVGEILAFRDCVFSALHDVLSSRLPFLVTSFQSVYDSIPPDHQPVLSELASALGISVSVDVALAHAMHKQIGQQLTEDHYLTSCLLLIGIAVSLPRLAAHPLSCYRPLLRVSMNNSHTLPLAVANMAASLFYLHGKGDLYNRMREFLAISSSSVLRSCRESSGEDSIVPPILAVVLDQLIENTRCLCHDELDSCFPGDLVLTAYRSAYQQEVST